jgi:hypothetical protein
MTPDQIAALNSVLESLYDVLEDTPEFAAAIDALEKAGLELAYIDLNLGVQVRAPQPAEIKIGQPMRLVDAFRRICGAKDPAPRTQFHAADKEFLKSLRIHPDLEIQEGR